MKKNALLSADRKYRYFLKRQWADGDNFVNFVLLNPSTADEKIDDPTIRRCINFAKNWGYNGIYVTNLFAFRTKSPNILKKSKNPVGNKNNYFLEKISRESKLIIVAWGNHGSFLNRDKEVLSLLSNIYCLDTTKLGNPKHPLYVKGDIEISPYKIPRNFYNQGTKCFKNQ